MSFKQVIYYINRAVANNRSLLSINVFFLSDNVYVTKTCLVKIKIGYHSYRPGACLK